MSLRTFQLRGRDFLREAARQRAIHGPGDWKHFNEDGYRLLGRAIADYLQADPPG